MPKFQHHKCDDSVVVDNVVSNGTSYVSTAESSSSRESEGAPACDEWARTLDLYWWLNNDSAGTGGPRKSYTVQKHRLAVDSFCSLRLRLNICYIASLPAICCVLPS